MQTIISLLVNGYATLPLPLLELWGRVASAVGLALAICAYGRFTLNPGGSWGFALERQIWNARAVGALALSFVLVLLCGWLTPGLVVVDAALVMNLAQDLTAFACVVLFGFPAVLAVPPAYLLSDLANGVLPDVVLAWAPGYVFWAAFLWTACQLIGRKPDFRQAGVWARYLIFVLITMLLVPAMWGYVCSTRFSPAISYQLIPPALFGSLLLTWVLAPLVLLAALPLARRAGMFWAEIPSHVKERLPGERAWRDVFHVGERAVRPEELPGVPLRAVLVLSFITLVLGASSSVAWLMLRSGQDAADKLSVRLLRAGTLVIQGKLDNYLDEAGDVNEAQRFQAMSRLLADVPLPQVRTGRHFVIDAANRVLATSRPALALKDDPVALAALAAMGAPGAAQDFSFVVVTTQPLARDAWTGRSTPFSARRGFEGARIVTAVPNSDYLADLGAGNSRAAVLSAVAVCIALLAAAGLAAAVAAPVRRITRAAEAMAQGELGQRVRPSRLSEMSALVNAFNRMSAQLQDSFARTAASERMRESIFSASPTAMMVVRTESLDRSPMNLARGREVVEINEAWERTTGHRREDSIGRSSTELSLWDRTEERQRFSEIFYEQGSVDGFEAMMRRADGSLYPGCVSAREVVVGQDRLAVLAVEDMSDQRAANAQLLKLNRQLNALLDAAVEVAIVATDLDGRITVFNSGAEKMLGYTEAEMLGESVLRLHDAGEIGACVAAFSILEDSGEFHPEQVYHALTRDSASIRNWTLARRSGETLQVSMALSAVRDEEGETLGYLAIARDITEQLAAQVEMVELNLSLDQRVRERTQAVQENREELQEALDKLRRMQSQLVQSEKLSGLAHIVAGVAHELNTPIGNSVTVASTLFESSRDVSREMSEGTLKKARFGEYLTTMVDGTALLERALRQAATLVSNFKRVAVDQGGSVLRKFDLLHTVNDIVVLLQPTLKKTPYKVQIDVPGGLSMESYPGALEQVVTNMINNAVAHGFDGREHGTMKLKARLEEEDPGRVRIEFSDDGVGMSDGTLAQIFNPFFTTALGKGGSGLGMSITYSLITGTLGGEISVNSVPGLGTQFVIRLPLTAAARAVEAEA